MAHEISEIQVGYNGRITLFGSDGKGIGRYAMRQGEFFDGMDRGLWAIGQGMTVRANASPRFDGGIAQRKAERFARIIGWRVSEPVPEAV